jgi:hypothetical protein
MKQASDGEFNTEGTFALEQMAEVLAAVQAGKRGSSRFLHIDKYLDAAISNQGSCIGRGVWHASESV